MQRLLGVAQVALYAFNPGPLLQPLLEWYQAQGFFQLLEWIIPASILKDQSQPCALPWFHASTARQRFGAPPCTYHQDNYQIGWWGQTLAVQDCTYRAMAAGHRWVAVMDLDEFVLPMTPGAPVLPGTGSTVLPATGSTVLPATGTTKAAAAAAGKGAAPSFTWASMILQAADWAGKPHDDYGNVILDDKGDQQQQQQLDPKAAARFAQFRFMGQRLCSGCLHQLHQLTQQQQLDAAAKSSSSSSSKSYQVYKALSNSSSSVPANACLQPTVGFSHLLWSSLVAAAPDHYKSIVDPSAVEQAGVHRIVELSQYWPGALQETQPQLAGNASALAGKLREGDFDREMEELKLLRVPGSIGLLLHDRVHDLAAGYDTFAAAMLRQLVQHLQQVIKASETAHVLSSSGVGVHDVPQLPPYAVSKDAVQCTACGGQDLSVDYTVCNAFGGQLQQRVAAAVTAAAAAGAFEVWFAADQRLANLYGGHELKGWAAPK